MGEKPRAGVISIMQVTPATVKQMRVGDIRQGTKCMRFTINQNYEHEPMTALDKALFTFALRIDNSMGGAYNQTNIGSDCRQ